MTTKVLQPKPLKPAIQAIVMPKHTGLYVNTAIQAGTKRNKFDASLGHIR